MMEDYTRYEVDPGNLLKDQNTDARAWAKSFIAMKKRQKWALKSIDEELMIGWFANAI